MFFFIAILSFAAAPICIADLSSFKIPNIYNKYLFYIAMLLTVFFGLELSPNLASSLTVLAVLFFIGIGMGDLKLLALIILTLQVTPLYFFGLILLAATVHIVISMTWHRVIPTKIALAPSIFIGLATYLATR